MNAEMEARQIIEGVVSEYGDECFISEGYAAGDDLRDGIATALTTRDAEIAALRRALEPLARVALPEDFHPGAPGEPAEDGWCNIYTGGLTNGDIRRARKLLPTPPAGGAHG